MTNKHLRAALEYSSEPKRHGIVTLERIKQLELRLTRSRLVWMIVSFVHMFSVLYRYNGNGALSWIATGGQIFALDYSTMLLAEYIVIRRRFAMAVAWYAWLTMFSLLIASFYLNYISVLSNAPSDVSATTTQQLAIILGLTPPMCIIVSALVIASIDETYATALKSFEQPEKPVNVDKKTARNTGQPLLDTPSDEQVIEQPAIKVDSRAAEWQQRYESGETDQAIADSIGKSKQFVNRERRKWLRLQQPDE